MYLGERIAEGSAEEVMQNETVRRVYIGGKIEAVERKTAAAGQAATVLDLDSVEVLYGKAKALDGVALRVHQDEFVSIVGLNGAGKTTLFNAISGLVSYRGSIGFAGRDLRSMTAAGIARAGVVHCPETRELFGHMTVRENLDLGGGHLGKSELQRQLDWVFDLFPILEQRQAQAARTLSGGEQQMLTLGRALMMQPKLLILDEPTLGPCTGHPRADFQGDRAAAAGTLAHAASRGAERNVRAASLRQRLCTRSRPHHLAGRSCAVRARNAHRVSVSRRALMDRKHVGSHPLPPLLTVYRAPSAPPKPPLFLGG